MYTSVWEAGEEETGVRVSCSLSGRLETEGCNFGTRPSVQW